MAREMKDSGIEWIGEIPAEWEISRLQWCLEEIKEKNDPIKTTNVLSLTNKLGVIPYEEKGNQGNKAKEDYSQYGLAFENTLVINSMNVLIGSVGISKYYGCVSPVYYVYRNTEKADLRFVNYVFQNQGFQKELRKYANGILEIRMRISSHDMLRRAVPFPAKEEQIRISDYLDSECARIDSVIDQTRASIEEYKKLKQAVITQAVTKGIRPDRQMKDSGNIYIEQFPKDWSIGKLKQCSRRIGDGLHGTPVFSDDDDCYFVNGNNLGNRHIEIKQNTKKVNKEEADKYHIDLDNNTLLISLNGTIGSVSEYNDENIILGKSAGYIKVASNCLKEYLRYYLQSYPVIIMFELSLAGTTIKNLSLETLRNLRMCIPSIKEQEEIANYLDGKTAEIDNLILKKENFILQMESYKKSLIYEYVTGKKEVPA